MDMRSWKKVLLEWITGCGFMERNYFNIEQTDIDAFYQNFILHHQKTATNEYKGLGDFLKEFYSGFDINFDDENRLSAAEYIYIYSILLHFCCVKYPEKLFHEICQRLPDYDQQCIAAFFKELINIETITKEALRHAISVVRNIQVTPPRLNDSFSSGKTSVSSISTSSFPRSDSPLKTPKQGAGFHGKSPTTPKTYLLEERTKELYNLRAQIDTEQYEKSLLEVQIKQNEEEIKKLQNEYKKLLQQFQDMKNDSFYVTASDGCTNRSDEDYEIRKRLLKELSQKEEEIVKLSENLRTLREEKAVVEQTLIAAKKQIILFKNRCKELEFNYDELSEELNKKNCQIKYLTDNKVELEQFIKNTRFDEPNREFNSSGECLDVSFRRSSSDNSTGSNINPENLGVSVIDVKLKEKEHENQWLKEELKCVQREHRRLAKQLTLLTQDFDLSIDYRSAVLSEEDSELDNDIENPLNENLSEDQISCKEQINIFNTCIEKIDKFHKTEKNKIKQLEQQYTRKQEENENLSKNLSELNVEINELKDRIIEKEKLLQDNEKSKEDLQLSLQKFQNDTLEAEKQKNKFHNEVQSLLNDKERLNKNIKELTAKLELEQQQHKELLATNKKLEESDSSLQTKLKELDKAFFDNTRQWQQEVQMLREQISKQDADIDVYLETEKTIKGNYEQLVVQNEELKKAARLADTHLCDMRTNLEHKEIELSSLGEEIAEIKQQNENLEQNICSLMEEHKQEILTSSCNRTELVQQLSKLKDKLAKMELLMDSKEHECALKVRRLEDVKIIVRKILKLFIGSHESNKVDEDDDVIRDIEDLKIPITSMLANNEDLNNKIIHLRETNSQVLTKVEELKQQLQEKCHECEKGQEELIKLREDNLTSEKKIEELHQQRKALASKAQSDLHRKEQELCERLNEASMEYEASMERIAIELKLEKEHHYEKEMELILAKVECNETKKKLNAAEKERKNVCKDNRELKQSCERLEHFQSKVIECSKENEKLRQEIETCRKQVTQNALRLLKADKDLAEFIELTKEQDSAKSEVDILQSKLKEQSTTLLEMELKLHQQALYDNKISEVQQQLEEQKDLCYCVQEQLEKLSKDKKRFIKEIEEKNKQISIEQQDKLTLLNSLEKSADQLKLLIAEKQEESVNFEKKLHDLKAQNTRLQGELCEREAKLRLRLEELQQQKEDCQRDLNLKATKLNEKTEQLEFLDTSLMQIVALIENNFNFTQKLLPEKVNNVFDYKEYESEKNIQKMRKQLNYILLKQQQINDDIEELMTEKENTVATVAALKKDNNELLGQLRKQEKTLKETEEQLENERLFAEKRVSHEVKRLEENLSNLEKVNDHLTNENVKIQVALGNVEQDLKDSKIKTNSLEAESLRLMEEIRCKSLTIAELQNDDKEMQQTANDNFEQIQKLSEKAKHFESQLKVKTSSLQNLEREYHDVKEKAHKYQQMQLHYQQNLETHQTDNKQLLERLKMLQTSNETLEAEVADKNKELLTHKNKSSQQHEDSEQQLNRLSQKLDEMVTAKLNAETKCEQLQLEIQQLKRDFNFAQAQQHTHQEDSNRLNQEIESLKEDKQHLRDEIHESKLNLQRANDNVSQLIQQISSIRLEKEAAKEENRLLRKQLEETGKIRSSSETKMKSVIEKSQDFERTLLKAENELKAVKANLEKTENSSDKLQAENKKLRDSQEVSTKRIEKLALKLGDAQARSAKLERDNEKLGKTLESHVVTVEALQKEKDILQNEAKSLKERVSHAERSYEQLAAKVQNLEQVNTSLQENKQKLEASEIDGKTKLNKLDKMRLINEEKIYKLTNALKKLESDNVKLNLEIGALNSQLKKIQVEHGEQQRQQSGELNVKLLEAEEMNHKYQEINEKLKLQLDVLQEDNSLLSDQLSKASLSLQITSQKCERFAAEVEQIRADMLRIQEEKIQMELQHEITAQKVNQFESQNAELVCENKNQVKVLEQKISSLEEGLTAKTKHVCALENEIKTLKENSDSGTAHTDTNLTELQDLRNKLSLAEDTLVKEQLDISQLRLDNQILHTKYQESKQRALDAAKTSEERIKENRLELEGKLEKMKNKMKTLYTEEITKMKTKQDRELAIFKSEMEVLKAQNVKYEEHTRKLSSQIVRLNNNILQHQKENTLLSAKLKHVMDELNEIERLKRPASIHVSAISSSTTTAVGPNNIAPNLAMEDEEGEVFNNTYLMDLKNGRMSEFMSRDVCVEELKYRNSLLPPHLRSTYAAQFDHEFVEDDLKDGPHSLDNSSSALLSTTVGGSRKKCSGVTHYKRPGPPTPSKNGGRLSFGGISEPAREILKESYDINSFPAIPSSKTPARFNFFTSRFSMSNNKDEKQNVNEASEELNLLKVLRKLKSKGSPATQKLLSGVGCTSTPRKSKVYYDQRRLLDQLMSSSPSPSPLIVDNIIVEKEATVLPPDVSIIETPLTTLDVHELPKDPKNKTITKRMEAIAGGLARRRRSSITLGRRLSRRMPEICTPTSGETTSSALSTPAVGRKKDNGQHVVVTSSVTISDAESTAILFRRYKKHKREKGSRPSLNLRGNIFAKYRSPVIGVMWDLKRSKSRKQRNEHFNAGRNIPSYNTNAEEEETKKSIESKTLTTSVEKCFTKEQLLAEDAFKFDDGGEKMQTKEELPIKEENRQQLVTSQDLDNFDRFIAGSTNVALTKNTDNYSASQGTALKFEKLLVETESNAPFDIEQALYNDDKSSSQSNHSHHSTQSAPQSLNEEKHTNTTRSTPNLSPYYHTSNLSRTIYGSTVIYDHRLPNINTTFVRKSSIYFKNRRSTLNTNLESSSSNDVVLITNQTINFIDIVRMWSQMDNPTRIIISFAILASFTTVFGLVISLFSRR